VSASQTETGQAASIAGKRGVSEGGSHQHRLNRGRGTTANDGSHRHIFLVDGKIVTTELDGAHQHGLGDGSTKCDGEHSHKVTLPDGTTANTGAGMSTHEHDLLVDTTAADGVHQHTLDLPGGKTIRSMTPDEFAERQRKRAVATTADRSRPPASPWFSPAGKKQLAKSLVAMIPTHHTYVEPFAGSGAVFFAKERAPREVLSDLNEHVAQAFRDLKALTSGEISLLLKRDWIGRRHTYDRLRKATPSSRVDRFYKFVYVSVFSYGHKWGSGFNPGVEGQRTTMANRIASAHDRMRGVIVRQGSYQSVFKQFDGKGSFFFLDPPYVGTDVNVGESKFDEVEFRKLLDGMRGRFLLTYGTKGQLNVKGFHVKRITPPRSLRHMRGASRHKTLPTLIVSNYAVTQKALCAVDEDGWEFADAIYQVKIAKRQVMALRSPDPAFIMRRLRSGHMAGVLAPVSLADRVGDDHALLNECVDPHDVSKAFGIVRLADGIAVSSMNALSGAMRDGIDDTTLREFIEAEKRGEGPFVFYPVRLVAKFDMPYDLQARPTIIAEKRGGLSVAQTCRFCKSDAVRALVWADGRAYLPVCPDCEPHGRTVIRDNGDSVSRTVPLPARKISEKIKVDETPNQFRVRLRPPGRFQEGSFRQRSDPIKESRPRIFGVFGRLKGETTATLQSLRFPKDQGWTASSVREWMRDHPDIGKALTSSDIGKAAADALDVAQRNGDRRDATAKSAMSEQIRLLKADKPGDEQFVLGVVMEPEVEDSQGDIYSPDEIREAAHMFMANSQKVGLMHRKMLGQGAVVVENFLAPADFEINGEKVRKGTWLQGIRIVDKSVWADVKAGRLTGLSIGGSAIRSPDSS